MKVENWTIERVKPYDNNPRMNDQAVDAVAESITRFGFRQPLVVDKNGILIVGHTRLKAAKKLGLKEVPVHVADLDEASAKAYRLADNQTGSLSDWNFSALSLELKELKDIDFDMSGFKFQDSIFSSGTNNIEKEWQGMPEFNQQDKTAFRDIIVHFNSQESVDLFSNLIDQKITEKTKMIWYPQIEIERYSDKRYSDES